VRSYKLDTFFVTFVLQTDAIIQLQKFSNVALASDAVNRPATGAASPKNAVWHIRYGAGYETGPSCVGRFGKRG
jgi:hypothetical protein